MFATAGGIAIAGALAPTGAVAVAIGVEAFRALSAGWQLACGGVTTAVGAKIEANHETHVAVDVNHNGKCLQESVRFGRTSWSAVTC